MPYWIEGSPTIGDASDYTIIVQIDKMEAKVVKPLLEYEVVCKKAKVS